MTAPEPTLEEWPLVPAGKVRLAEPGDPVPMARKTLLETRGSGHTLTEVSRGFEIAGSALRWTERKYVVGRWICDAFHGRSFRELRDAEHELELRYRHYLTQCESDRRLQQLMAAKEPIEPMSPDTYRLAQSQHWNG